MHRIRLRLRVLMVFMWAICFIWLLLWCSLLRSRLFLSLIISTAKVKSTFYLFRSLVRLREPFEEFFPMSLQFRFESLFKWRQSWKEVLLEIINILCLVKKTSLLDEKLFDIRPFLRIFLETRVDERSKFTAPIVIVGKRGWRLVQDKADYFHMRVLR